MPRKTNYDVERREREKSKAAESAKKAQAKADKKVSEQGTPDVPATTGSQAEEPELGDISHFQSRSFRST